MGNFSFILDKDRQEDIVSFLLFRYWMLSRTDRAHMPEVLKLLERVRAAKTGVAFSQTPQEFGIMYSAAQYTMAAMTKPLGKLYLDEMTKGRKPEEWKTGFRQHLIETCMYLVNESNVNFQQVPGFMQLRMEVEAEVMKM